MATSLLIDTDMGIDDAVATCLAIKSKNLDVRAIVGVGGNVPISQVMQNMGRILGALAPPKMPAIGKGLEPPGKLPRASFGQDGLGEIEWRLSNKHTSCEYLDVYRESAAGSDGLTIVALGPLTNVARAISEITELRSTVRSIVVSGGAAWAPGNATKFAEFNFHRDPQAAAAVLSSGLPITIVPLDVTTLVCLDESHVAHLASCDFVTAQLPAKLLRYSLANSDLPGFGKAFIQDAIAVGSILWPDLFMKTRMTLEVVTAGPEAGKCKPTLAKDKSKQIDLLTAVNAVDLLENIVESLCHEAFVV